MTKPHAILPSDLIIHDDGSVFHLRLRPGQLADTVILVGDPGRVERVAGHFEARECHVSNREYTAVTGAFRGKRMTVLSTGIGAGNVDIVMTELDALANIDFATRTERPDRRRLTLLRLGTCGALQPDIRIGDWIFSRTSAGFDGLLNFYAGRDGVCDLRMEAAFVAHTGWNASLARPCFVHASERLAALFAETTRVGITATAPGFYAPQGRRVRLQPADPQCNEKIESFDYEGYKFANYEMESAPLTGLARLMGHDAATICTVIAQRVAGKAKSDYQPFVDKMIVMSLEKLASI